MFRLMLDTGQLLNLFHSAILPNFPPPFRLSSFLSQCFLLPYCHLYILITHFSHLLSTSQISNHFTHFSHFLPSLLPTSLYLPSFLFLLHYLPHNQQFSTTFTKTTDWFLFYELSRKDYRILKFYKDLPMKIRSFIINGISVSFEITWLLFFSNDAELLMEQSHYLHNSLIS